MPEQKHHPLMENNAFTTIHQSARTIDSQNTENLRTYLEKEETEWSNKLFLCANRQSKSPRHGHHQTYR